MVDVLPSWRDTATRDRIVAFVEAVSGEGPAAVPVAERIAVFDNDGTLWTEKPMPTQLAYIVQQWAAAARSDPTLAQKQPYKAVVTGDFGWLGDALDKHYAGDDGDLKVMIGALLGLTADVDVQTYAEEVADFYRDARHPTLGRPYSGTVYQPMIELLRFLEAHGMLRFAGGGRHPGLGLLIHHDDDTGRGDAPYDKGAENVLAAASDGSILVVSVKDDWAEVFPARDLS